MNRELLIECTPELTRAAVIEDGSLCEIHQERTKAKKRTESLFYGRVRAIRPSVGAAFIDIGEELNAFLPLRDGHALRCGDDVIVQGAAVQSVDTKGLRVSDTINLAGKWLVLVPGAHGVRLSKKIQEPGLREALIKVMEPLCPHDCGFIVRTASADVTEELLAAEAQALTGQWEEILLRAKGMTRPGILHEPLDLPMQLVRDIGTTLSRVVTNMHECAERMNAACQDGWLSPDAVIECFEERSQLLCDAYALDAQVDKALKKRVWLDCGGYLVFDICEALTVIDVNSGKMTLGRDTEDTALRVNLEAAKEIARQLRLRDIGGIIVVDYIDMQEEQHRHTLLAEIKKAAKADRSQVVVGGMTRFGLVEMTRKRRGEQLNKALQTGCKACGGNGRFLAPDEVAFRALRQLRRMMLSGQRGPFLIRCTGPVASALSGMRVPYAEQDVYVQGESGRHAERFEIEQLSIAALPPKGAVQLNKG